MKKPSSICKKSNQENKVILCCGTFDLLHRGHLFYLREASKLGKLCVLVARDSSVMKYKNHAPVENENERLAKVQALDFVKKAYLGDSENPLLILEKLKPSVLALGYDQALPFRESQLPKNLKVVRLKSYKPEKYKTSLLRKK